MEMGDRQLPAAKPDIELEWSGFLQETMGAALSGYGWFILFGCIVLYILKQKFSPSFRSLITATQTSPTDPNEVVRRQEAVAAARLRMQEELNAQAERYKEKQKQVEEEKRRHKIESWESMKEGKSYKITSRVSQEPSPSTSASSSAPKPKQDRRPLKSSGYNPLTGDGGGTCAWRPGRRGPSAGG